MVRFLWSLSALFLLSACLASEIEKSAPNSVNPIKQPANVHQGKQNQSKSTSGASQYMRANNNISGGKVATQAKKTTPKSPRDVNAVVTDPIGSTAAAPKCNGIPSTVSPRVLDFLSCEVIQILSQPERVESFLLEPEEKPELDEQYRLGPYPIQVNGQGSNLEGQNLKKFQKLVLAESSYVFGMEKRCRFEPFMGLHFVKGDKAVEVLFSRCMLWRFISTNIDKLEDFDPIGKKLKFLDTLFSPPSSSRRSPSSKAAQPARPFHNGKHLSY